MIKVRDINKVKVGVIIQARMGSTRLYGKVMKILGDKPVLWHVVERVKRAKLVDTIIIATTETKNKEIVKFCVENNILCFCGSEENVLDRYYNAAKKYELDAIVRVTSDCPLIDPLVIDKLIETYLNNRDKYDYISNSISRTYPRGLECSIFSFYALEESWKKATKPHHKEHVVLYIRENYEKFSSLNIYNETDLSHLRWTLDTNEDYVFLTNVFNNLYKSSDIFTTDEVLKLLRDQPDLIKINAHIEQKKEGE
ncbi:cytidylyltransferase domain-containing protein [Alkaliphilus peptidifermentans]|uniref:Spore coat polysaccharide biosynthesis protein SpsF n=1 Tax=Alkaliphilus peptidifermentans DSM 18978 TaxID=1120976 RepID=A0A1G5JEH0_9FIRM|nr:glycosyltransferase family protein [Alkaliphilus peptidifermentans]SCY86667.1 spore coat polysaccharide biosynthesis protein SpsF [Alkaliphilus peptidifermentans DSM 18978]